MTSPLVISSMLAASFTALLGLLSACGSDPPAGGTTGAGGSGGNTGGGGTAASSGTGGDFNFGGAPPKECEPVPAGNLFPEGDMEGTFDWVPWSTATVAVSDIAHGGTQSLELCNSGVESIAGMDHELFDAGTMVGGKTYRMGFCVRSKPNVAAPDQASPGLVYSLDGKSKGISSGGIANIDDAWRPVASNDFALEPGAAAPVTLRVSSYFEGDGETCMLIDDVYVVEVE